VHRILAADVGGTHSRMGFFELDGDAAAPRLLGVARLSTPAAGSFPELLANLFSTPQPFAARDCDLAVLAVAGPVEGHICTPPNIKWKVDLRDIAAVGLSRGALINDFAAQPSACRSEAVRDARVLQQGQDGHHVAGGAIAVIGAGTGLGHCALVPDGHGGNIAVPSEAGHAPFPFVNDEEFAFGAFVRSTLGLDYCVGDVIVTGGGLARLHAYLTGEALSPAEVTARLAQSPRTVEWFARFYGRAARMYALAVMALGGVYLAGGVAARNPILVEHPAFLAEFRRSGTHGAMLAGLPVLLNANQDSGMFGAALHGAGLLRRGI